MQLVSSLTFGHSGRRSGLSARVPECQKVKKGGLDLYGAERFGKLILPQSEKKVWDWKG